MKIGGPTNPFHVARAYGAQAPTPAIPVAKLQKAAAVARAAPDARAQGPGEKLRRLIAAPTPGRIDFSGESPRPASGALQMYTRPADRNAVATTLQAGRMIDVAG